MRIFSRYSLAARTADRCQPALLLEGAWPEKPSGTFGPRWSLDDSIDARHEWVDSAAAQLAHAAAGKVSDATDPALSFDLPTIAYLNALKLRYYLVSLLRFIACCDEIVLPCGGAQLELHADGRDDDLVALFAAWCQSRGLEGQVVRHVSATASPREAVQNRPTRKFGWRRAASWVNDRSAPQPPPQGRGGGVIFCGNRDLLGGVCDEIVRRRISAHWLYDRFALKTWLRWRARGVGQLVCDSSKGPTSRGLARDDLPPLTCRGVDLTDAVRQWLSQVAGEVGPRQMNILARIDGHFARLRPDALILDEDATPFARAAVFCARRHQVRTLVVQHGAPCVRFGFAPLAADRVLTWGEASNRQLTDWGVPRSRIQSVGCPRHARLSALRRRPRPAHSDGQTPRVLLLANVPPRDARPDAVSFHLTGATYDGMLRMAAAVCAARGARLVVKPHPRDRRAERCRLVLAEYPTLKWRMARSRDLARLLKSTDCVLSCASSAGVEAAWAGWPVVGLMPEGSADLLPAERWGLVGTARDESELRGLLDVALSSRWRAPTSDSAIFADVGQVAAARVADAVQQAIAAEPEHKACAPEAAGEFHTTHVAGII